jgi:hypothetical protein
VERTANWKVMSKSLQHWFIKLTWCIRLMFLYQCQIQNQGCHQLQLTIKWQARTSGILTHGSNNLLTSFKLVHNTKLNLMGLSGISLLQSEVSSILALERLECCCEILLIGVLFIFKTNSLNWIFLREHYSGSPIWEVPNTYEKCFAIDVYFFPC